MIHLKKYSTLLFLLTALLTTIFINISCEDNPVAPNEPPPGSSNYIVTVDTIDRNYTVHTTIWGTSENNMWAGGSGSENIWHYDGEKWEVIHLLPSSINSIYGFAENDIYAAAAEGRIFHFNGVEWYQQFRYGPDGNNPNQFTDIWGYSSTNIYAAGFYYENHKSYGIIFHFNGTEWKQINIPKTEGQIHRIRGAGDFADKKKLYFILNNLDFQPPDSSRIFELNGENIKEIYYGQFFTEEQSNPLIETLNGKVYFGYLKRIHSYDGNNFILERTISIQNYSNWFNGRSINDLILSTTDGFTHYNGKEVKQLYRNNNLLAVFDYIVTDSTFFAVAHDYDNRVNLVIKGILQNN